jgi:hypothetical protein
MSLLKPGTPESNTREVDACLSQPGIQSTLPITFGTVLQGDGGLVGLSILNGDSVDLGKTESISCSLTTIKA